MQLKVTNHASAVIRQVMFPFFKGLDAVDGEYETAFTTLGFRYHPYRELNDTTKQLKKGNCISYCLKRCELYFRVRPFGAHFFSDVVGRKCCVNTEGYDTMTI